MPLYYSRLHTLGLLGHQITLRRKYVHSVASMPKLFPFGEFFLLLERNISYFTARSVEKQSVVFFVAVGIRFFCV